MLPPPPPDRMLQHGISSVVTFPTKMVFKKIMHKWNLDESLCSYMTRITQAHVAPRFGGVQHHCPHKTRFLTSI